MKQCRGIRPRPRSVIIRAGIFLLLGAIVNVAVAWGSYTFHPLGTASVASRYWAAVPNVLGEEAFNIITAQDWRFESHELGLGTSWSDPIGEYQPLPSWCMLAQSDDGIVVGDYASGWPCRTVHFICRRQAGRAETIEGALTIPSTSFCGQEINGRASDLTLPAMPIWPGFAINTLFYAAILWLLFAGPGALRRWRRIKRGLCPACAYPVGASDLCTECGALIPSPLRGRAREGVECTSSSAALNDAEDFTHPPAPSLGRAAA